MPVIYIVSGRYGVEMEQPVVYKSRDEAEAAIKDFIAGTVVENHGEDLANDGVDEDDYDAVLAWAENHDYVASYNNLSFPDTYTDSDDWSEYMITEVDFSTI